MVNTAVIMAAGLGTRFGKMTEKMPKGFIECGGKPMVIRSIETLIACGIGKIVIGTGYKHEAYEALAKRFPQVRCVYSPRYAETNSMYTLWQCREAIGNDDFILLESDIIYSKNAITRLQNMPQKDVMLITPVTKFQDQYYVEYSPKGILTNCSTNQNEVDAKGELVGIHKLSNSFYKELCGTYAAVSAQKPKLGYEYQLLWMSQNKCPMYVLNASDVHWYEIDDEQDLAYAEQNIIKLL